MSERFVKLRYGLVDHLLDGRMSGDEYGAFSLIALLANIQSGIWQGSGIALAAYLKSWSVRKCQRVLKSLARKNYLSLRSKRGAKGNYPVIIRNYHGKVTTRMTPLMKSDDTRDATLPKVTTPAPTKEERTKISTKTPLPPVTGGQQIFEWCGQAISVDMGRKRRLPNLSAYEGGMARDVVEFLTRRGFPAQIVNRA